MVSTIRPCDSCGAPYEAIRRRSRFCGDTCRRRATRARQAAGDAPPGAGEAVADADAAAESELVMAVRRDLAVLGVEDGAAGRTAIELARSLADPSTPASARAALARELRATLAVATANGQPAFSPTDRARAELARLRAERAIVGAAGWSA